MKDLLKKYKKTFAGLLLTVAALVAMVIGGHTPTVDDVKVIVKNYVAQDYSANTQIAEDALKDVPAPPAE